MDKYELMENSLMKNIQELSEYLVDNLNITNYYELLDILKFVYDVKMG